MNICVIGTGYVGLVTGAVLADLGNDVICTDKDEYKINLLNSGRAPIYEPGLDELITRNTAAGRLSFDTDTGEGVRISEVVFIAVGTPPLDDGQADMSAVIEAAHNIACSLNGHKIIVNKSTVPVGTGDTVREIIERNKGCSAGFDVVSNPEFLREGSAIVDTLQPDRIVIGASNKQAAMRIAELYLPLARPILITDIRSAEMIKYASNAFLATKISFVNAVSNICEMAGADVKLVAKGMGLDKRIGPQFLEAGLGYGGSCFGKDVSNLIYVSDKLGYDFKLLKAVVEINSQQPDRFISRMRKALGGFGGRTVGVLGLAFKPDTDDMRDAKSIDVIGNLLSDGAIVKAYDPVAIENARRVFPHLDYCDDPYSAADGADALVIATEWREFKTLDMESLRDRMAKPVVFDGRNMFDPKRMKELGFEYHCIGRGASPNGSNGSKGRLDSRSRGGIKTAI